MKPQNYPAFKCKSCSKCSQKYCNFYKRPVDEKYNNCFHHSKYEPFTKEFKQDKNLEIIMKAEEQQRKKHYKGYLSEDKRIRKAILKEIEKEKQQRKSA